MYQNLSSSIKTEINLLTSNLESGVWMLTEFCLPMGAPHKQELPKLDWYLECPVPSVLTFYSNLVWLLLLGK